MSKIDKVTPQGIPDAMNPRVQPLDMPPLVDPDMAGTASPAGRALIGLTQAISPRSVRQEQLDALQSAVDAVNTYIRSTQANYSIRFEVHQRSGLTYALIRNAETGQVLKQIPSETLLNIAARVRQASGIFADLAT
jgi:uncharacterized FlaG/YvyC family protein